MEIPTLETARLWLVAPAARHFESYAATLADVTFTTALGVATMTRAEADRSFCARLGHWQLRGPGHFIVEEKASGAPVGLVGINRWEGWPEPELGWWTYRDHWRKGYAVEAARAVLEYARRMDANERLISLIRPNNVASIRVAEKLGARLEKEIDFLGGTARVYVHTHENNAAENARRA